MGVHYRNYKAGIDPSLYTSSEKQMDEMSGDDRNGLIPAEPIQETQQAQAPVNDGVNGTNGVTVVKPTPSYVTDWSKGFAQGIANGAAKEKPLWEVMQDYDRWAKANNGEVLDGVSKYVLFNQWDPTKSIAKNEEEDRHRKSQAKWEQIGNVFSHLGNFVGTMRGAPVQPLESGVALTERQRKIRDAVQAQRRQTANDLLSLWYKDIADQRAAELNAANIAYRSQQKVYLNNKEEREKEASDALVRQRDSSTELNKARKETEDSTRQGKIDIQKATVNQKNAQANKASRSGSGGGRGRSSSGSDNRETVSVTTRTGTTTTKRSWKEEHKNSKGRPYGKSKGKGY